MAKPEYGGVHFLGTGTYTALNQEAADQLYADVQQVARGSRAEQQRLAAESGADDGDDEDLDPRLTKDRKGR